MKFTYWILFLSFSISSGLAQSKKTPTPFLEKGITEELARFRKHQVSNVTYGLSFSIPKIKTEPIASELDLNLNVSDLKQPLYLDFNEKVQQIKSIIVNGVSTEIQLEKEHIIIPQKKLKLGHNNISISFIAGNLSLNRNEEFLYTLLVPDRASTLFPCFDQPDLKATYKLNLTAPKDWSVLCGASIQNQIDQGEFINYQFEESDKMSTYLFSFVVGKFSSVTKKINSSSSTMLYRENNAEKIQTSTDVIFDLHEQSVGFLEKYTQYPFPFKKLDFAAIPSYQYGGMEHVGAIQYNESSLFLDNSATESEKLRRAKLIAHETSHMWFGDLVTMKWFDDVWMKEVFANFMADKIMNPLFPKVNHDLQFLTAHYLSAYSVDRTVGTNPIKQKLANLKDAGSLYGSIIYNKAPIMMRQLEMAIGEEVFRKGIQKYIHEYANSNADWNDLVKILDEQTTLNIKKWSNVWVNKAGRPVFKDYIEYDAENHIKKFEIKQKAEDQSKNFWPQIFEIGLVYPDSIKLIKVSVKDKITNVKVAIGLQKPTTVIYNYSGYGYGVFPIDSNNLYYIPTITNEVAKAYSFINLYENVLTGKIVPIDAFNTCLKGIVIEKNELIVKLLSNYLKALFWNYLTVKQQVVCQREIEKELYQQLQTDLKPNIKKTLFWLYSSMAYSESDREKLYLIWNKETNIANLKLNEDDYTNIAMDLIIYKHKNSEEILSKAKAAISNPDKQKRLEFLLPSLSENVAVRDAFMESLKEEKNRENESWVLAALGNIYHPLRQESSKKYLKANLYLLEEIQLTGDIFFPLNWLEASVGEYSSAYAYNVVKDFLRENPNFNPILKMKLMQATDGLYRAQRIKKETE